MAIWFSPVSLDQLQPRGKGTILEHLEIKFTEIGDNFLSATMPVDHRTVQPMGILHGGASMVLAETLGSMAAALVIDNSQKACVGLDINANHIRAVKKGIVTGTATPI